MDYKLETKNYQIKIADNNAINISKPQTVFEIVKDDFDPFNENLYLLIINIKNNLIKKILIAKGSYNSLMANPIDFFRPIILTAGNKFILAHNHPSGDITPSEEDINFTNRIKKASNLLGLALLDHIIFTDEKWYSFKKELLL